MLSWAYSLSPYSRLIFKAPPTRGLVHSAHELDVA